VTGGPKKGSAVRMSCPRDPFLQMKPLKRLQSPDVSMGPPPTACGQSQD